MNAVAMEGDGVRVISGDSKGAIKGWCARALRPGPGAWRRRSEGNTAKQRDRDSRWACVRACVRAWAVCMCQSTADARARNLRPARMSPASVRRGGVRTARRPDRGTRRRDPARLPAAGGGGGGGGGGVAGSERGPARYGGGAAGLGRDLRGRHDAPLWSVTNNGLAPAVAAGRVCHWGRGADSYVYLYLPVPVWCVCVCVCVFWVAIPLSRIPASIEHAKKLLCV